jgi:hypothetical protein
MTGTFRQGDGLYMLPLDEQEGMKKMSLTIQMTTMHAFCLPAGLTYHKNKATRSVVGDDVRLRTSHEKEPTWLIRVESEKNGGGVGLSLPALQ